LRREHDQLAAALLGLVEAWIQAKLRRHRMGLRQVAALAESLRLPQLHTELA